MDCINYAVFVTTAFGNQFGTAVSTTVIPARGKTHAETIANQINSTNPKDGSHLVIRAIVVGD